MKRNRHKFALLSVLLALPAWGMGLGDGQGRTMLAAKLILPLTVFQLALRDLYRREPKGGQSRARVLTMAFALAAAFLLLQIWNPIYRVWNGYTEVSRLWVELGFPALLTSVFVFLPALQLARSGGQRGLLALILALEWNALLVYSASFGTLIVMPLTTAGAIALATLWPKVSVKVRRIIPLLLLVSAARVAYLTWLGSQAVGLESPIHFPSFSDFRYLLAWGTYPWDRLLYSLWFTWIAGNFLCALMLLVRPGNALNRRAITPCSTPLE